MERKQQFNVYLPPELIRAVKHAAVDVGGSLSDFVAEALASRVQQRQAAITQSLTADEPRAAGIPSPLSLMPVVYVRDVRPVVPFYQALGFQVAAGDRAGEWVELRLGSAVLMLHLSDRPFSEAPRGIELSFISSEPLEAVVARLTTAGFPAEQPIIDESFGRFVKVTAPDGLVLQINEHDRTLYT